MAYFLINKETNKTLIIINNTVLADLCRVHRQTINNWFKNGAKIKETDKYTITKADEYYPPTKSGGNKDSIELKRAKAQGEEECKYPRKNRRWRR